MPHLISPRAAAATAPSGVGIGVPGLAHPLLAPAEWAELTRPGTPVDWVVLNAGHGPGERPDPHCLAAAGRLRKAGVRVLGHLDLTYGARPFGEVVTEAHRYLDWYLADGFLLDRCPTERAALPEVRRTVATLRALAAAGREGPGRSPTAHVVLGHGGHPYPGYAESGDQLITFEGPWSDYRWSQAAEWTADYPPERFCHLVHSLPAGHLEEALRIARWQGAGTVCFTDRTERGSAAAPWETMPGYWDAFVSHGGTGVSE
ncbi:spherulation-specific family 4 protein [Streptomyces physcomitrii]|uniref:Phage tail protein n=1 Tax=Streptomyces physcomitrii TaxID=2724184 RepID=A0ABX1GW96_9ACTN|nr:spherulation-specific family 4 protein [Streptomyces physcomitrii]NKI40042.1 phage tail protein [Streptomyces physcomitrii]